MFYHYNIIITQIVMIFSFIFRISGISWSEISFDFQRIF